MPSVLIIWQFALTTYPRINPPETSETQNITALYYLTIDKQTQWPFHYVFHYIIMYNQFSSFSKQLRHCYVANSP